MTTYAEATDKTVDTFKQGARAMTDRLDFLASMPSLDFVEPVERYFEYLQKAVDLNREMLVRWAELAIKGKDIADQVVDEAGQVVDEAVEKGKETAEKATGKAKELAEDATDTAKDLTDEATVTAEDLADDADETARKTTTRTRRR